MKRKIYMLFIILLAAFCFSPAAVHANSAEPPALIVIMKNAPQDISVSIISEGSLKEGKKKKTAWETYYAFYQRDLGGSQITLRVSGDGASYEQAVAGEYLNGYNSIVTLDFSSQSIEQGKLLSRSIFLVTLRVLLTLIIEGLIFFMFGFRDRNSWIIFLLMNLLTQGVLNIVLNGVSPFAGYLIFNVIFMEFWVFLAEIAGALILIKEHGRLRRVLYVLAANIASLVLGGYLITALPI